MSLSVTPDESPFVFGPYAAHLSQVVTGDDKQDRAEPNEDPISQAWRSQLADDLVSKKTA